MAAPMDGFSQGDFLRLQIRKLRKKLRQIENLERLDRALTEEEEDKVFKKFEIRSQLQELLSQCSEVSSIGSSIDTTATPQSTPSRLANRMAEIQEDTASESYGGSKTTTVDERLEVEEVSPDADFVETVSDADESNAPGNQRKRRIEETEGRASGEPAPAPADSVVSVPTTGHPQSGDVEPAKKPKPTTQKAKGKQKNEEKKVAPQLSKEEREALKFRETWRHCPFRVRYLDGHNDMVLCVACDGHLLVSGGRDTMVKIWDTDICAELKSCGGHTGTVTSVLLLPEEETNKFVEEYELEPTDRVVISGSTDCSIRLWSSKTGHEIRSIYTYNSVTALGYIASRDLIVSGSDGGKLELWDAVSGRNVLSITGHQDAITSIKITPDERIFLSSRDCMIKIYLYRDSELHLVYESEVIRTTSNVQISPTPIRCIDCANEKIYYGDEGFNIKVLDWKKGRATKIRNHTCEFGMTDCVRVEDPLLIASGFDLDNAFGYLNIYNLATHEYLATLNDEDTTHIFCLACTKIRNGRSHRWITGGDELKVWDQVLQTVSESSQEDIVETVYDDRFLFTPDNSDLDSDTDSFGSDGEVGQRTRRTRLREPSEESQAWSSWCIIL